jgi:hypothetical protein
VSVAQRVPHPSGGRHHFTSVIEDHVADLETLPRRLTIGIDSGDNNPFATAVYYLGCGGKDEAEPRRIITRVLVVLYAGASRLSQC